ncbi:MAG: protein kinase, partial [Planctomycetota bacterium]
MHIGRWELSGEIGRGGAGVVYRGRGPDGKTVAIKILRETPSQQKRARFEREERLLQSFGAADGFVPLLERGDAPQGPYFVMPFLPGGTLRQRLEQGPLEIDEAVRILRRVAAALGAAHAKGIVHRDVKPENVLFDEKDQPFLADLGLAKHFSQDAPGASQSVSISGAGDYRGSVRYSAPEQLTGSKDAAPPSDVFSLGAVLYECIAGEPTHLAQSPLELIRMVLDRDAPPLAKKRKDCPAWLAATIDRALARDPRKRFQDAQAFAEALARAPAPSRAPLAAVGVSALVVGAALLGAVALRSTGVPSVTDPPAPSGSASVTGTVTPPPGPPQPPAAPEVHLGTRVPLRSARTKLARVLGDIAPHFHGTVDFLALSPDDRKALTVSHRGDIVVWDIEKGEEVVYPPTRTARWFLAYGTAGPRALGVTQSDLRTWSPDHKG